MQSKMAIENGNIKCNLKWQSKMARQILLLLYNNRLTCVIWPPFLCQCLKINLCVVITACNALSYNHVIYLRSPNKKRMYFRYSAIWLKSDPSLVLILNQIGYDVKHKHSELVLFCNCVLLLIKGCNKH
jgi:hypothetical protein